MIFRSQQLLDIAHIGVSPGNQNITRSIVGADRVGHALCILSGAVIVDFEAEILRQWKNGHVGSSVVSIY